MDNYHKVLMIVYDLVVVLEKQRVAEESREFDEGIFLVYKFTPEERSIISIQLLARSEVEKEQKKTRMKLARRLVR